MNGSRIRVCFLSVLAAVAWPALLTAATRYVWSASPVPTPPFADWSQAAHTIQAAIDSADTGDLILLTNEVHLLTAEVVIDRAVVVQGANGATNSVVDGGAAVRCFRLAHAGAALRGLTLRRGLAGSAAVGGARGGGVYAATGGLIEDCLIVTNRAVADGSDTVQAEGGGLYLGNGGTVRRCRFDANRAHAAIVNPMFMASATAHGGGACVNGSQIEACAFLRNEARATVTSMGGASTSSQAQGGGAWQSGGLACNCLAAGNTASAEASSPGMSATSEARGGGFYLSSGVIEHGTLASNYCAAAAAGMPAMQTAAGGGLSAQGTATVRNSILLLNQAVSDAQYSGACTFSYCCAAPLPPGAGNLNVDPDFRDAPGGDYRLGYDTPILNMGSNAAWAASGSDLDGQPRLRGDRVEPGAYEGYWTVYVRTPVVNPTRPPFTSWYNATESPRIALREARNGYRILVSNGVYTASPTLAVTQNVQFCSLAGAAATLLVGGGKGRVLTITAPAWVEGFTVTNGLVGDSHGGGVWLEGGGTLRDCIITGNRTEGGSFYGGGIFATGTGLVDRCIVRGNQSSDQGGGAWAGYDITLRNTLIHDNAAPNGGGVFLYRGAALLNGTVVANTADSRAGGVLCYSPSGTPATTVLDSIIRFNSAPTGADILIDGASFWSHNAALPAVGASCVTEDPLFADLAGWDFHLPRTSPCVNAGTNRNGVADERDLDAVPRRNGVAVDLGAYEFISQRYVALTGRHLPPFADWRDAANTLQDAVDASTAGDTVWVTNGVYTVGGRPAAGRVISNRVTVENSILVRSVNGPSATIIRGQGPVGAQAVRCVYLTPGAELSGFTLSGGRTAADNQFPECNGGGAFLDDGGTLSYCLVTNNQAAGYGGGVAIESHGQVVGCLVAGNLADIGGGVNAMVGSGSITRSVIQGNHATSMGGGICLYENNRADNCLVSGNACDGRGGGICLIGKVAVRNCTVTGNTAGDQGGGIDVVYGIPSLANCIAWGNDASDAATDEYGGGGASFSNCCTRPEMGVACVTNAPAFAAATLGDFHLRWGSPCIDAGLSLVAADLDSRSRPIDGDLSGGAQSDIGAYERDPWASDDDGDGLLDADEVRTYGTNPADRDTDGDRMIDPDELFAGTQPTNDASCLRILAVTGAPPARVFFPTVAGRLYQLHFRDSLTTGNWQPVKDENWIEGNDAIRFLDDPAPADYLRFYRIEVSR